MSAADSPMPGLAPTRDLGLPTSEFPAADQQGDRAGLNELDSNPAGLHAAPGLRIVRGEPDEYELAALVAGLGAALDDGEDATPPVSRWTAKTGTLRPTIGPVDPARRGADAWRWSLR